MKQEQVGGHATSNLAILLASSIPPPSSMRYNTIPPDSEFLLSICIQLCMQIFTQRVVSFLGLSSHHHVRLSLTQNQQDALRR